MNGLRAILAWTLAVTILVTACDPIDESGFASDVERELDRGRAYASQLIADSREEPTAEVAIAVGYLERLRLGLGSPFRLIEYSLQDSRLDREMREQLAWSLLAATLDGEAYRVDPGAVAVDGDFQSAIRHLELVEGAIAGARDADAGALAVRLAYSMASAESAVSRRLTRQVAEAAALIRDRSLAQQDVRRLLRAAGGEHDPRSLVTVWRVERRFAVEAPSSLPLARQVERDAIDMAPRLLDAIRDIHDRPRLGPVVPAPETRQRPLLGPEAAARLAAEAVAYRAPPQTPVAVAVNTRRSSGSVVAARVQEARDRFFTSAWNEETLAAEYALLSHRVTPDRGARQAVLAAAVALRAYAQERPWMPGFPGPASRELEDRFGLAEIHFPDSVPAEWRPYYRRMLESGLSDLQRVLPSLNVRGLSVRFEGRDGSPGTLAVHDPRTRTIYIPPASGSGTLAHEIAHDLDWQTALRLYNVRGDYGSDRAMRRADGRLARVLRGLTTATLVNEGGAEQSGHASRPAEVFARSIDWFVAVSLAREGRLNGYLSSVQDDMLTGYGTVTPPDVTGEAGQALMLLLDDVAPVYPATRQWFLESYGRIRSPGIYDLARRVLEAPLGPDTASLPPPPPPDPHIVPPDSLALPPEDSVETLEGPELAWIAGAQARLERLELIRDSALGSVDTGCSVAAYDDGKEPHRRAVIAMVAEARGRGIALRLAEQIVGPDGRRWMTARLRGRTGTPEMDPLVAEAFEPIVERVAGLGTVPVPAGPALAPGSGGSCGLPLLAD